MSIIVRDHSGDVSQLLWALHSPEVHIWVVGPASLHEPLVPIVSPLATRPQCWRQAIAPTLVVAAAIVVVAVEVPTGVPRELALATIIEDALSSARNLKIETVLATHIIADVCDLDDHTFALKPRMGSTTVVMTLASKLQLETLAAILITVETMVPADSSRCESHAQVYSSWKWLVIWTRGGSAACSSLVATN